MEGEVPHGPWPALPPWTRKSFTVPVAGALIAHCREVARTRKREFRDWTYWLAERLGFGDPAAALLIVGLAPAAHGANRTGRMFTGDSSGKWPAGTRRCTAMASPTAPCR